MDVTLQLYRAWKCYQYIKVSILVLMDVTLQLSEELIKYSMKLRFNPCFNGCYSSTRYEQLKKQSMESFNPCFNGCYSSTKKIGRPRIIDEGFNPCFNGCYSSTSFIGVRYYLALMFQSLF